MTERLDSLPASSPRGRIGQSSFRFHEGENVRSVQVESKAKSTHLCFSIRDKGFCRNGERCRYLHESSSASNPPPVRIGRVGRPMEPNQRTGGSVTTPSDPALHREHLKLVCDFTCILTNIGCVK